MGLYPIRSRLPASYNAAIGRIVARFAVLEGNLRHAVYAAIDVNTKIGRIAVRTPRIEDTITMISDLLKIRRFSTTIDLKLLSRECGKIEKFRDQVAHGLWVKHKNSRLPILQVTAGHYQRNGEQEKVKARIDPLAINVTLKDFSAYSKGASFALKAVKQLEREIVAQQRALRKKLREQARRGQ